MTIRERVLVRVKAYMDSRPPDLEIGPPGDRYMLRWIVGPWGRGDPRTMTKRQLFFRCFPNLYLHRVRHNDEDRALHDHPFPSCSWLLENGYWEVLFYPISQNRIAALRAAGQPRPTVKVWRPQGGVFLRRATEAHRLVLDTKPGKLGRTEPVEVISAFFIGFRSRDWGFHCPRGWIPWKAFVSDRDRGAVGAGCGD